MWVTQMCPWFLPLVLRDNLWSSREQVLQTRYTSVIQRWHQSTKGTMNADLSQRKSVIGLISRPPEAIAAYVLQSTFFFIYWLHLLFDPVTDF